jgi:endonuclease YncB( thermonuclease family)
MKKLVIHLLLLSFLTLGQISRADVLHGLVVAVSDGDTITVLDESKQQHKIRLMGIDAPEKKQAYGQRSKESLSELVYMKEVEVTWSKHDRYGRTVGQVSVDGTDMCLEQIKRGMAWHYKQYQREQLESDRSLYSESESVARDLKIGLWHDETPIEPSSFRYRN